MRAAGRDPAAFTRIYRRHASAVHAVLAAEVGSDVAEDITAETFARAWLHRRRFRDERDGSVRPWLMGIARNVLRDSARARRVDERGRQRLGVPWESSGEMETEVAARLDAAAEAPGLLAQLSSAERAAVELRVVEDLPFEEVARRLEVKPAAARLRVSRALRRLSGQGSGTE